MRLRRFSGPDAATALRQVKDVLGADAVIVATERDPAGGVVITAAVDPEPWAACEEARREPDDELGAITRALQALCARVAAVDARRRADTRGPGLGTEAAAVAEQLAARGLARPLALRMAHAFEGHRREGLAHGPALEAATGALLPAAAPDEPRVRVFVGATGCGKTTTIAKLAAAATRGSGPRPVLVMADTFRIGAAEQLGSYARLLDVPIRTARGGAELAAVLRDVPAAQAVYVDTAGLGGDHAAAAELRRLVAAVPEPVGVTAVVSAATSALAHRRMWRHLGPLAPSRCVVTKVDEAGGLGATWSWTADVGVRVCWLGTGQRVPEDLAAVTGQTVARWMLAA